MKIEKITRSFQATEHMYSCPICHSCVEVILPASMVCRNGHCFDISKNGYINFLQNQKQTKYTEKLFESRRIVFENGFYEPLAEEISNLVAAYSAGKESFSLLDVGCGEGYYDWFLQQEHPKAQIYAIDNVKEAIRMGTQKSKEVSWIVGDLANLPFQQETMDFLLEIFAPSNYAEFQRLLKKDGYLIKILPGENYLKELRVLLNQSSGENYSTQPVEQYFCKHMKLEKRSIISYEKNVNQELLQHFWQMSPMSFDRESTIASVDRIDQLTFEFVVLLGRK